MPTWGAAARSAGVAARSRQPVALGSTAGAEVQRSGPLPEAALRAICLLAMSGSRVSVGKLSIVLQILCFTVYFTCALLSTTLELMLADEDPMTAALPPEVPLPRAPLVRVLAQLRFPFVASIENAAFIAP